MGDGMKRATLEAVLSRGPWTIDGFRQISPDQARAWFMALPDEAEACRVVGAYGRSDRTFDRMAQIFKRAGLVVFDRATKRWQRV